MHGLLLIKPVAVAMLILANAFFVAAEFALVSIRDTRVEQLLAARVPGARAVRRLQHNLDDLLPAVQLGVTLCSLALGWLGEPLAAQILGGLDGRICRTRRSMATWSPWCLASRSSPTFMWWQASWCPKALALRRAEALAVAVAPPMLVFMAIARPAVRLLSRSAAIVLRAFDIPSDRARRVHPLRRGAEADCHGSATAGPAARVSGDAGAPRTGARRCAGARDHDAAAEDLLAALEHAA